MNSFAACQVIFFRFKGKRWQEMPCHRGQGKTKARTVHDTGAEFLCDLEHDLCFACIFVLPVPGKELWIFLLQGCFQASWMEILQGLIIWHRSPCCSGVWHGCHSKVMVRAEENLVFIMLWTPQVPYTVLQRQSGSEPTPFNFWIFAFWIYAPSNSHHARNLIVGGRIWMDSISIPFVVVTPSLIFPVVFLCLATACVWLHSWWGRVGELDFTIYHPI